MRPFCCSLLIISVAGCELITTTDTPLDLLKEDPAGSSQIDDLHLAEPPPRIVWNVIPASDPVPAEVSKLSTTLERLHATTLTAFESAPDFGFGRMPYVLRESSPPRHVPPLFAGERSLGFGRMLRAERPARPSEPKPSEAWRWLKLMSGLCADGFVYRTRDADRHFPRGDPPENLVVCGFPVADSQSHDFVSGLKSVSGNAGLWKISKLELIGLWNRDEPTVFEHRPEGISADAMRRIPVRPVDQIEAVSLAILHGGSEINVTYDSPSASLKMVSAIRATETCLACHEGAEQGTLLGAFTFGIHHLPGGLEMLARGNNAPSAVREALRRRIPLKLKDATPLDAIAHISKVSGLRITVDPLALEAAGDSLNMPTTFDVEDAHTSVILRRILHSLNLVCISEGFGLVIIPRRTPTF